MTKLDSITEYAVKGGTRPENRVIGFGSVAPETVNLNFACENSDGRFYYIGETRTVKPGTEIELPDKCGELEESVVTGMPLVGWSLSPNRAERGLFDYHTGEKFTVSMTTHITFFPVFESYTVQVDKDTAKYCKNELVVSPDARHASVEFDMDTTIPEELLVSVDPDYDRKCKTIERYTCVALIEAQESSDINNASTVRVGAVAIRILAGERIWIKIADDLGYVKVAKPYHDVSLDSGEIPVKVTFFDWISEWQLYPKVVYFGEEDEGSSENDN